MKPFTAFLIFIGCFLASFASPIPEENERNPEEGDLIEGDIVFDPFRNGLIGENYKWPENLLTYELDPDFSEEEVELVMAGIRELEENTCVRFRKRDMQLNYVFVQRGEDGSGCFSSVGRRGGKQILNLAPNCIPRHGTIVHEFIHAIGFYHEQSRPDRDDWVDIIYDKIEAGKEHNFNKYTWDQVTAYDVEYDYGSVMHYSAIGFSIDGSPTIVPKDPDAVIGQRVKISEKDALKINRMYGCDNSIIKA